jgi:hypothetical protein
MPGPGATFVDRAGINRSELGIVELLQQVENDRTNHQECGNFHGDPPVCAGTALDSSCS